MRFLSLFAGIGGFDLGLERTGHECIGQVEIDGFCQRVLAKRFNAPRWTDVREWQGAGDESVDLIVGGFPCQDLSVAGKRAGLGGSRSGLFWEIIRIQKIIKAPWGLFENVPGLRSSQKGSDMLTVLQGLRECWPAVGYRILDSRYFGVAQRRRRVFFVCGPTEASVREVLFEPEGGGGNPPESGEAGEGVADTPGTSADRISGKQGALAPMVARAVARGSVGSGYRYDPNGEDFVIAPTLVAPGQQWNSPQAEGELREHVRPGSNADLSVVSTLNSGGNDGGFRTEPVEHLIPLQYAEQWERDKRQNGVGIGQEGDSSFTLDASYPHRVGGSIGVRRLTPLECELLQSFPPGWTCLCQSLESYRADPDEAAMRCKCPDSPRYRALGNAVTVNVIEWIGKRLPKE